MQKDHNSLNKVFGSVTFLVALGIYWSTMPRTAPFWDSSEFIACSYMLQVPHPPGSPFLLLLGRLASMFAPTDMVSYMVNMVSVVTGALSVALLYLIIVRFLREFMGDPALMEWSSRFAMYAGGLVGALTFMSTDSHWFNSTETETYAISMFFTALTVWLTLKWSEQADQPGHERWLVLIAYVFGLAFGVHLLSLLATFFVAMIVYFRTHECSIPGFLLMGAVSVLLFFSIYPGVLIWLPSLSEYLDLQTGGFISHGVFLVLVIGLLAWGLHHTHTSRKRLANILLLGYMAILFGYSSYGIIFVRSQTQPPIDQNAPETVANFISYLKREQYGSTPLLSGNTFNNDLGTIDRRSESLFPRRYSREARHTDKYSQYSSDWDFFWRYQIGHMYFRYFAWNFIGRDSDLQDAHWVHGFVKTESTGRNAAHNVYFFLPFFLGLVGMFHHFQKDWKRASTILVLFIVTGVAIVFYLNQTPFQPRERDYAYTGSFFAFSIWIGIGASTLLLMLASLVKARAAQIATGSVLLLAVPGWMIYQNWDDKDRSLQYVAPDYAYNLLNSVAPNAILFTNGDNDTFPLWYLQDVEGIRRDVRVVNLSLLNTNWYIKQMKNKPNYEAAEVPILLSDEEVDRLEQKFEFRRPNDFWTPQTVELPVIAHPEADFGMPADQVDPAVRFFVEGQPLGSDPQGNRMYYTRLQDDMILEILRNNEWRRPIYFAITVAQDGQLNLQDYFRLEGKAFRVMPKRFGDPFGHVDPLVHGERLRGFRFREIGNDDAYFDENIRRMMDNYRTVITRQAQEWEKAGFPDSAKTWLRWGEERIPFRTIRGDLTSLVTYAYRYSKLSDHDSAVRLAQDGVADIERSMVNGMAQLSRLESQIVDVETKMERYAADLNRRRTFQNEIRGLSGKRDAFAREISFDSSRFMIIQHILFQAGRDEEAAAIAIKVNEITNGRLPFPTSRVETEMSVTRIMGE